MKNLNANLFLLPFFSGILISLSIDLFTKSFLTDIIPSEWKFYIPAAIFESISAILLLFYSNKIESIKENCKIAQQISYQNETLERVYHRIYKKSTSIYINMYIFLIIFFFVTGMIILSLPHLI